MPTACGRACCSALPTLTLGTLPNEKQAANQQKEHEVPDSDVPKLGLTLAPGKADGGVVVTAVDPNGVAADHGFQVGDVILDVSGKSVASPADVRRQIADARKSAPPADANAALIG